MPSYAEVAESKPAETPVNPATFTVHGFDPGSPIEGAKLLATPLAEPNVCCRNIIRIYSRGTRLEEKAVDIALRNQLGVNLCRIKVVGSSHVDVELKNEEEAKRAEHRAIHIGEVKYHIGPTFMKMDKPVPVILSELGENSTEDVVDAFRAKLGKDVRILGATHGYSLQREYPGFQAKVYLSTDQGVRLKEAVPRKIDVNGDTIYVDWYHATPICHYCGRLFHTTDDCWGLNGRPGRERQIMLTKARRNVPKRARKGRNLQTTPALIDKIDAAQAPGNTQSNDTGEIATVNREIDSMTEVHATVIEEEIKTMITEAKAQAMAAETVVQATATEIKKHVTFAEVETNATEADAEVQATDANAETYSKEADAEAQAADANVETYTKDADAEVQVTDANAETYSKDADAEVQATDANAETYSKDADAGVQVTDANAETYSKDADAEVQVTDANAETYSKDADAEVQVTDANAETYLKDADAEIHAEEADTDIHTTNADIDIPATDTDAEIYATDPATNAEATSAEADIHTTTAVNKVVTGRTRSGTLYSPYDVDSVEVDSAKDNAEGDSERCGNCPT
jgi:hypothetical protein